MPYYLETKLESEEAFSVLREIEADPENDPASAFVAPGIEPG